MKDTPFSELRKDSLVEAAQNLLLPIIDTKAGNTADFDFSIYQTRVFVNQHQQWVHFNVPIKYLPCNTNYYGNISVELISSSVSFQHVSNPDNSKKNPEFYQTSSQSEKVISFVITALNKNEPNTINPLSFGDDMLIVDQEKCYRVTIQSEYFYSDYKIEKGTGIMISQNHEELIPPPEEMEDKLIEIIK